ncbi:IS1634 family transposase [Petrimonas mucosa]|jgi:transposase|uniref:Transposase IS4 family protein n=1 Tax=Petrimonas mucosa TaxID=1642646 RepID=A0A1G4G709_9BACT|nr:transposase [Petrimonas mucosa]SCM57089.1 Transposase IS4 family protein {ECO:0000313/EMBL:ADY14228,1} [Petrimonas mucosa]SCM57633.1 Transposase IS4 family protein {ECO:0000313/EMBL:ADY14228,1} [Petrimonas mucosa]
MGKRVIEIKAKNGTVYLYEDESYWDREKGYSTHKRTCIGKKGADGEAIYNTYYRNREKMHQLAAEVKKPNEVSNTTFVGETMILDKVTRDTGVSRVLTESFGENDARKIIALSYYQICRGKALSNAEDWLEQRGLGNMGLSSQRVSELLERLKQDKVNTFFQLWAGEHAEKGSQLFDLTSVSTYGKRNPYAEYGYNRDRENLEQINLALLTSCGSGLPMWYQVLPGSMSDKVILDQVLSMMKKMEVPRFTFVGDRGFYSDYNLELLSREGYKFTIPVPSNVAWQKKLIAEHRDTLVRPGNLIEQNGSIMYGKTIYKTTPAHGRTWYHLYFDPARKDKIIASFMQKLRALKDELEADKLVESHRTMYERYFIVKETPVRGRSVNYNDEAIQEFINSDSCYWVLISTSAKTAVQALEQYRERNGVELYFDDEKNLLDLRRLKNHSEQTIKGKIFVTFISLIILARLRKMVGQIDKKKRKHWSEQDMLRKVETYARVHFEGKYKDVYSTPTAAQRLVFDLLEIPYTFKGKERTSGREL